MPDKSWICCQLGSREHYAVPRMLHREGLLSLLLTDYWAYRPKAFRRLPIQGLHKLAERQHRDLQGARVADLGFGRPFFDARSKAGRLTYWETVLRRNHWFQEQLLERLRRYHLSELRRQPPGIFFAYSYAAGELFRFFKDFGWTAVLGQIDPAQYEEDLVAAEIERHPDLPTSWTRAPRRYWLDWRREIELADVVMVNSDWTRKAIEKQGVTNARIQVVPLAYEKGVTEREPKPHPRNFDRTRPLRILFLGQINFRKGLSILLDTVARLHDDPVEFWMVGPTDVRLPDHFLASSKVKWFGSVSRSGTARFYRDADLFLLPTLSDGFALTQLEAQAHHLPVIASRRCGNVVKDGKNGVILDPLTPETLVLVLRRLLAQPELIEAMSRESGMDDCFSLDSLRDNLLQMARQAAENPA